MPKGGAAGPTLIRPYAEEVLYFLKQLNVELILWTAGISSHAKRVADGFNTVSFDYIISRDPSWMPHKTLSSLRRPLESIIIVDDNPSVALHNMENLLGIPAFSTSGSIDELPHWDTSLLYIINILKRAIDLYREVGIPMPKSIIGPLTDTYSSDGIIFNAPTMCSHEELIRRIIEFNQQTHC